MGNKMPERRVRVRPQAASLMTMFETPEDVFGVGNFDSSRMLLSFKVPEWQRPLCWTLEQNISFIESIWYGYDLGVYMIHEIRSLRPFSYKEKAHLDRIIIDGQQRINAIRGYISNEFEVFDSLWKDVDEVDKRNFKHTVFACTTLIDETEEVLRDTYNRLNFAGVKHLDTQRA